MPSVKIQLTTKYTYQLIKRLRLVPLHCLHKVAWLFCLIHLVLGQLNCVLSTPSHRQTNSIRSTWALHQDYNFGHSLRNTKEMDCMLSFHHLRISDKLCGSEGSRPWGRELWWFCPGNVTRELSWICLGIMIHDRRKRSFGVTGVSGWLESPGFMLSEGGWGRTSEGECVKKNAEGKMSEG